MRLNLKIILLIFLVFNLSLGAPGLVYAQLSSPTPPSAPSAPTPPSPPEPPSAPSAPSLPGSSPAPSESSATNTATGADSTNTSQVSDTTDTQVSNTNAGEVTNNVDSQAVTGGNSASYNTGGGQITTGDANQSLNVVTNMNQNQTLSSPDGLSQNQSGNLLTGSGSQNESEITKNLNQAIANSNVATLNNKIVVNSVSGQNSSSYNTSNGNIQTGDANADLSMIASMNTNVTGVGGIKTFNIYDNYVGDIAFKAEDFTSGAQFNAGNPQDSYQNAGNNVGNNSTGADSINNSDSQSDSTNTTANTNQAVLKNDIIVNALSGANSSSKNSGSGEIATGDANAVASLVNFLNTNLNVDQWMIGVVNIFGQLTGDIILPSEETPAPAVSSLQNQTANSTTGADSTNTSGTQNSDTANFANYNNAEVMNNIETCAVTGTNTASYNTGPGQVVDGNATVNTSAATVANNNIYAPEETLWLVLVNKMGEWVGQIVGQDPSTTMAGNLIDGSIPQTSQAQATNNQTGAGSENTSSTTDSNNETISNTNDAKIENNIKIIADTGDNSGSYNTLGGGVTTGDAQAALSLVNFVNNNIVGKKLVVLVVNVLDQWIGDVIPPQENNNTDSNTNNNDDQSDIGGLPNSDDNVIVDQTVADSDEAVQVIAQAQSSQEQASSTSSPLQSPSTNNDSFSSFDYYLTSPSRTNPVRNIRRGIFVSPVLAGSSEDQAQLASGQNKITTDWLYFLLPSFLGVVATKNKKIRNMLFSFL